MSMLDKIEKLRDEAWQEVMASPALATVRALDDAVEAAGGKRLFESQGSRIPAAITSAIFTPALSVRPAAYAGGGEAIPRMSQADAAEQALLSNGPLPVTPLMTQAIELGANVGGEKPLVSFRSTLSKDDRFYSIKRDGYFYWWLTNVDLPEGWMGPSESYDLPLDPDPESSQRGGDSHAATT